ncbi:hypothetical protein GGS23DRAFT_541688 [Durotheca rogersii]|uniref:uncharacterized protein n=1 Tax=Durotheca rogersii TaxID=419775 RepID=UPI002221108E|nr:uncharacterized protein GGS23DRAFT_541688 [Durotheca rogersii]KAI5852054.1 hypothetical protein GGS23DRAFT_541688 [Durotheca rogersii]
MASSVPFTVEDVHQGWPNEPILYRIRVPARGAGDSHPGQVIRYLTAPNPPKGASGVPDHRGKLLAFDAVPAGDWNLGRLVSPDDSAEGKFVLASTETAQLEEAVGLLDGGPSWCDRKVDLVDLLDPLDARRKSGQADDNQDDIPCMATDIQCMNHISAAVLPTPAGMATATLGPEVIGVWAWPPGHAHGIADESHVYSIIQARDPGMAPRFLAHVTDNGTRVIGFLLERIADAREAGPADLEKCKDTLSRLHALGIAYGGPLKRHSFLVCDGGAVLLQGFGGSFETTDKEVLGRELEGLEQVLAQQPSELEKFNAPVDIKLSDRLVEFRSHGLTHPFVHWQLANSKRVTLTAEQHREMVAELAANNYRWTEEDMERAKQRFGGSADVAVVGAAGEPTG